MSANTGKIGKQNNNKKTNEVCKDMHRNKAAGEKKLLNVKYEVLRNHLLDTLGAPKIDKYRTDSRKDAEDRYKYCEIKTKLFSFARLDKIEYYSNNEGKIFSVRKHLKEFKREIDRW